MRIIDQCALPDRLSPRAKDSHKGDFGSVGILGGAPGMVGAALLAGRAALHCGAGRVYVGLLDERLAADPVCPELMLVTAEDLPALPRPSCLIVGPGMGASSRARMLLEAALKLEQTLLLDADALNLLADDGELLSLLRTRSSATLLTPHPGEAARLLKLDTSEIQRDRIGALARLIALTGATVALKGHATLVQHPDGDIWCNGSGNAAMAAPGMGDVLTGIVAALIAQGMSVEHAAVVGVWLHGQAGDDLMASGNGLICLTASEIIQSARGVLARI